MRRLDSPLAGSIKPIVHAITEFYMSSRGRMRPGSGVGEIAFSLLIADLSLMRLKTFRLLCARPKISFFDSTINSRLEVASRLR
jgi:hypothetical protein